MFIILADSDFNYNSKGIFLEIKNMYLIFFFCIFAFLLFLAPTAVIFNPYLS